MKQIRSYFDFSQPNLSFFWHMLSVISSPRGHCCDLMPEYIRKPCVNPLCTYNPCVVLFMELSQAFCHATAIPSYVVFFFSRKPSDFDRKRRVSAPMGPFFTFSQNYVMQRKHNNNVL